MESLNPKILSLPNKGNDPGLVVLALPVLQTQVSNLDARDEPHVSCWGHLVELGEDLTSVRGQGHQHGQVGQGHQGHVRLRVGPRLGVSDQVYGVL